MILSCYVQKRGAPDSPACAEARRRQVAGVSAPTFQAIAGVVGARLAKHREYEGLDDVSHLKEAITEEEATSTGVPEKTSVPPSIQLKIERCLNETVEVLVKRGLITSAETLARVLPQMTSGLRATSITDPALRRLYASIYRAFRRRRSLLLLNLEKQVQIEDLPWVAAIDRFRNANLPTRELARQTLDEVTVLTLTSFPHAIIPNKLLQEMRALVTDAHLDIPLVDELATDIFTGEFSGKFLESAKRAAELLEGTLYAIYFGIDYLVVRKILTTKESAKRKWFWQRTRATVDSFAQLCASRAGVPFGRWHPATNGMVIEQQQILTTQNLAALFVALNLNYALRGQLGEMARQCFRWICKRQQMQVVEWHARLIMHKNTAYAWRQMIFYLALLSDRDVADFLLWAEDHLNLQIGDFRNRFRPALKGLVLAANGILIDSELAKRSGARRFLGWSDKKRWLPSAAQGQ